MQQLHLLISLILVLLMSCSQNAGEQLAGIESSQTPDVETVKSELTIEPKISANEMYPELANYISAVVSGIDSIPEERKELLNEIAHFVQTKVRSNAPANLTFICTHNSRRSHLSQIWAATAAAYYSLDSRIYTFSGGTEATAFNPRAVAAIERAGFKVENPGGENPRYKVTYSPNGQVMECFSKKYDDAANASQSFAAVMTCSDADKNCPFIPGASLRVALPYDDPKDSDGTEAEAVTYDERCRQIATEMFYLMSQVQVQA